MSNTNIVMNRYPNYIKGSAWPAVSSDPENGRFSPAGGTEKGSRRTIPCGYRIMPIYIFYFMLRRSYNRLVGVSPSSKRRVSAGADG